MTKQQMMVCFIYSVIELKQTVLLEKEMADLNLKKQLAENNREETKKIELEEREIISQNTATMENLKKSFNHLTDNELDAYNSEAFKAAVSEDFSDPFKTKVITYLEGEGDFASDNRLTVIDACTDLYQSALQASEDHAQYALGDKAKAFLNMQMNKVNQTSQASSTDVFDKEINEITKVFAAEIAATITQGSKALIELCEKYKKQSAYPFMKEHAQLQENILNLINSDLESSDKLDLAQQMVQVYCQTHQVDLSTVEELSSLDSINTCLQTLLDARSLQFQKQLRSQQEKALFEQLAKERSVPNLNKKINEAAKILSGEGLSVEIASKIACKKLNKVYRELVEICLSQGKAEDFDLPIKEQNEPMEAYLNRVCVERQINTVDEVQSFVAELKSLNGKRSKDMTPAERIALKAQLALGDQELITKKHLYGLAALSTFIGIAIVTSKNRDKLALVGNQLLAGTTRIGASAAKSLKDSVEKAVVMSVAASVITPLSQQVQEKTKAAFAAIRNQKPSSKSAQQPPDPHESSVSSRDSGDSTRTTPHKLS